MARVYNCDECGKNMASVPPFTSGWRDAGGNLHLRDYCSDKCSAAAAITRLPETSESAKQSALSTLGLTRD